MRAQLKFLSAAGFNFSIPIMVIVFFLILPSFSLCVAESTESKLKKRNAAYAITAESVIRSIKQKKRMFLIDTRSADDFEQLRIPGSINMPFYAVKTKRFLKPYPLVIITPGFVFSEYEAECERLRKKGYQASIIIGGINAWKNKGGSLIISNMFAGKALNRIPPHSVYQEKDYAHWVFIDATESQAPLIKQLIPRAKQMSFEHKPDEAVAMIKKIAGSRKADPFLSFLIFNTSGQKYDRIEKILEQAGIQNTYFLKDGFDGYASFVNRLALINKPKGERIKSTNKCKDCN